ncbi:hypothetical protein ACFOW1_01530 [Parasediminibacterium paludis]|uniref:Uncharacterized protein n=1 Tax=Parasediminibacterium paludis TaxID=908966 RepID=A0ABV8PR49_9BACT
MNQKHLNPTLPKGLSTLDQMRRNQCTARRLNEQESLDILNATIAVLALQDFLQKLERTSMYKHDIKKNAKALFKSLDSISLVAGAELLGNDEIEDSMAEIIANRVDFINRLSQLHPEQWQIASYILRWAENPNSYFFRAISALCIQQDAEDAKNKPQC